MNPKDQAKSGKNHHDHGHHHSHDHGHDDLSKTQSRPHPLAGFFACLLGDDPAPISEKIQKLREVIPESQTIEQPLEKSLQITKDMVVLDLISNFPQIKDYLEEIHPLGLLSPRLDQISLELFLSDFNLDLDKLCSDLTKLVHNGQ